jgi:hypothetical protein
VALTGEQRTWLENIGDFTEDQFLQAHYRSLIVRFMQEQRDKDTPVGIDALVQWAREREWTDLHAGMLAGMAAAVNAPDA